MIAALTFACFGAIFGLLLFFGVQAMATMSQLVDAVRVSNDRADALIVLTRGLKTRLDDVLANLPIPPATQAEIDSLFAEVEAQKQELSDALVENTPPPTP
jgi:hypothetical protein